jgi:P27 family predicted phage terminase small subunit
LKNSPANRTPTPPKGLSKEAASWWRRLHAEFDLADEAGRFLLEQALRAFDRMNEAGALVTKHGVAVSDRFGQLRANPAAAAERDARAAMLQAFKALNLDVMPPTKPKGFTGR